jgi:hypothetical protein
MLEARPVGIFSRDFDIEAAGQRIATLHVSRWKEAAALAFEGRSYKLYREGVLSGAFLLELEGQVVARAVKPSVFRSRFELELDSRSYSLERASVFGKTFRLSAGDAGGGTIQRAALFTRKTAIDLPPDWPIPVQVFAFWLVLVIWNRQRRSGGAAAAAAAAGG